MGRAMADWVEIAIDCAIFVCLAVCYLPGAVRRYRMWRHGESWYYVTERRRIALERIAADRSTRGLRPFSLRRAVRGRGHPHRDWSHLTPPPGRRFPVWRAWRRFASRHLRIFGFGDGTPWRSEPYDRFAEAGKPRMGC